MKHKVLQKIKDFRIIISSVSTLVFFIIQKDYLINLFNNIENKINLAEILISLSVTLLGFIVTFLTIFLVYKTDDKYKKEVTETNKIILLINSPSFKEIYYMFMKYLSSLLILLVMSLTLYFFNFTLALEIVFTNCFPFVQIINFTIFQVIYLYIFLVVIVDCLLQLYLSITVFNETLKAIIKSNK